jgi:hypothetical protein
LTGVKRQTFEKMLEMLKEDDKRKKVKGGLKNKLSLQRVVNENVIGSLKIFKIINDRYRNRRKRFGLRFNLIAAIHNLELS